MIRNAEWNLSVAYLVLKELQFKRVLLRTGLVNVYIKFAYLFFSEEQLSHEETLFYIFDLFSNIELPLVKS